MSGRTGTISAQVIQPIALYIDINLASFRLDNSWPSIMAISRFVNPEWLVEIEVDAVVAD